MFAKALGIFTATLAFTTAFMLPVEAQQTRDTASVKQPSSTESTSTTELAKPEESALSRKVEIEAHLEIRNTENRQNRPENKRSTDIQEFALSFKGLIQKELGYFIEGAVEQFNGESEFLLKEAYLNILPEHRYSRFKVGQFYYPVGWLSQDDHWFISKPSYYGILFKGAKPLDTGASVELHPFEKPWVYATGSCFAGKVFRAEDGRDGEALDRPCEASLRSQTDWFDAYYSYFQHHLAFFDPVKAHGIGIMSELTPVARWNRFQVGVVAEGFIIEENHQSGGTTNTEAWMAYVYAQVYRLRAGLRTSETLRDIELANGQTADNVVKEDLYRVEAHLLSNLNLIYEDELVKSDLTYEDRWALRLLADWQF